MTWRSGRRCPPPSTGRQLVAFIVFGIAVVAVLLAIAVKA